MSGAHDGSVVCATLKPSTPSNGYSQRCGGRSARTAASGRPDRQTNCSTNARTLAAILASATRCRRSASMCAPGCTPASARSAATTSVGSACTSGRGHPHLGRHNLHIPVVLDLGRHPHPGRIELGHPQIQPIAQLGTRELHPLLDVAGQRRIQPGHDRVLDVLGARDDRRHHPEIDHPPANTWATSVAPATCGHGESGPPRGRD